MAEPKLYTLEKKEKTVSRVRRGSEQERDSPWRQSHARDHTGTEIPLRLISSRYRVIHGRGPGSKSIRSGLAEGSTTRAVVGSVEASVDERRSGCNRITLGLKPSVAS